MYYNHRDARIELSVRELCALAYMRGNIDNRYPHKSRFERANEGREAHEALRRFYEAGQGGDDSHTAYYPELSLRHVARCDDLVFSVSGRTDGVWYDPAGACVVEEIKSVAGSVERYGHYPREVDLAQLTCYGYFLCAAKGLSTVTLRLTYTAPGHEEQAHRMDAVRTVEELRAAYIALLHRILPRARDMVERETTLRTLAKEAVFPYREMREAQRDMIVECWRDMRAGKTLFAQAPTGIGKTIATLYPAVRCYGENRCDKIFYLTAKNATRREAFGAMQRLVEAGTPMRACVITAREAACLCETAKTDGRRLTAHCNPVACPYARGYYDRAEAIIGGLLSSGKTLFSGIDIREAAKAGEVCPYELALDLSERCEVIICDYNYVFSPTVSLRRYLTDDIPGTEGHRYIFLVDEAHNLPDRARDMYGGYLTLAEVCAAQDALHALETEAAQGIFPHEDAFFEDGNSRTPRLSAASADDLIGALSRMAGRCAESLVVGMDGVRRGVSLDRSEPVELVEAVRALSLLCDRWLYRHDDHPLTAIVDGLAASLRAFRTAAELYDRRFATFTEVEGTDVRVRLCCLDPAGILRPILQKAVARVLFSATLTPADYFADILGGDRDSVTVAFDSPFPTEHLCVAICDRISTRYEDREASYRRVVSYIAATVSAKPGNYMVYFPSYAYLEQVYALFCKKYPTVKTVVQTPGMSYAEREDFIASFAPDATSLQIGFCVLGGSFSEGVDLPGRCLIGAIIVGVGIPGLSNERNIMRDYYDERAAGGEQGSGEGYAYAYTYPGMNHVLQAAGRVIRRPEDRGVVVLLDDRYAEEPYRHLYPAHWENLTSVENAHDLFDYLTEFWGSAEAADQPL